MRTRILPAGGLRHKGVGAVLAGRVFLRTKGPGGERVALKGVHGTRLWKEKRKAMAHQENLRHRNAPLAPGWEFFHGANARMWNTRPMRVYLPLLGSELLGDSLSSRRGFTVIPPSEADAETIEVLEDDAQTEAALVSLTELREREGEAMARLIAAADVADTPLEGEGVVETAEITVSWNEVVAILADSGQAAPAVLEVVKASEQDQADEAVAALWEHALEWFDVSEREVLAKALGL